MDKKMKLFIIKYLQTDLDESEKMWNEGNPPAQIVGYLQGTIKALINSLEE
jgi:hypothetical protein|tara:strand:+ start:372 stop:524 length:153 start_codon:yes stop_codon:yes gene_type:complete